MTTDFWAGRSTFVTGATGFLGTHLVSELLARGARVAVLRRPGSELTPLSRVWVDQVSTVDGSLRDGELLGRALERLEVRSVFHLAAQTQVGVAQQAPVATLESNVQGAWALLEAARRAPQLKEVVVASTDKVYGPQRVMPLTEDMPLLASDPYNASKACVELIARSYASSYGLPVAMTRCANFYGPGDRNWQRIVPGTLRSILNGQPPVLRSNGRQVRDYLFVKDGVSATLALAEALAGRPELRGESFNFSAENPMTAVEMVERIQRQAGTTFEPQVRDEAVNEIFEQRLSAQKARDVIGWRPEHTLERALDETIAYYEALKASSSTRSSPSPSSVARTSSR